MTKQRILTPVLALLFAFALFACDQTTTTAGADYGDFDFIEDFDEAFNRREGTYIVYLYSETCENCNRIKDQMLAFAAAYDDRVIFFFDVAKATTALQDAFLFQLGKTTVNTPTLILITANGFDKTVASRFYFEGASAILGIINDLENGSYQYWE
jgi:thiol-disulfide isomerase/thioredoxin